MMFVQSIVHNVLTEVRKALKADFEYGKTAVFHQIAPLYISS